MEKFKKIEDVMNYDSRFDGFIGDNFYDENAPKGLKLHHIYAKIEHINLNKNVHEDIHSQFNIAKNIYVYSWYCYPFTQVAELKAISTLEFALKMKFGKKRTSLSKLLENAINNNQLIDSSIYKQEKIWKEQALEEGREPIKLDYKERTKARANLLTKHRNDLAHGSNTLNIPSSRIFEISADFINQLFTK